MSDTFGTANETVACLQVQVMATMETALHLDASVSIPREVIPNSEGSEKSDQVLIPEGCASIQSGTVNNPTMKDSSGAKEKATEEEKVPFLVDDSVSRTPSDGVSVIYSTLLELCRDNAVFYKGDESKCGCRLYAAFILLVDQICVAKPLLQQLLDRATEFDFDETTPANGYRSYVSVMDSCVAKAFYVCQEVKEKRDSVFFRKTLFSGKVERYSELLTSLTTCLHELIVLLDMSKDGELFADEMHSTTFLKLGDNLNTLPFYGPSIGFQFCESMRIILRNISIGMATYSKIYESEKCGISKGAMGAWSTFRYAYNPHLRAERLAAISKFASLEFCKSFWFLSETDVVYRMSSKVGPSIAVNLVLMIEPEPLKWVTRDGKAIEIPIASSFYPPAAIPVHLFSATKRIGMCAGATAPLSRDLIIHCHGGGFVAQSPRSHEIYLRDWARQLDVPILSIDYSLAPKAPFPRPLEEALYAYCWAVKNCHLLGSTAEQVLFVGDSAGANLCMSLALKCIDLNLPRPIGLFVAYFPVLVSSAPSPSRMLSFMDPILPYGFLLGCLRAYACPSQANKDTEDLSSATKLLNSKLAQKISNKVEPNDAVVGVAQKRRKHSSEDNQSSNNIKNNNNNNNNNNVAVSAPKTFVAHRDLDLQVPHDPFLSPWWASDEMLEQLPPISILTLELDPCLDDCVMFARRLKRLSNVVTLDVEKGLPHGFLYFAMLCDEAHAASNLCVRRMKQLFDDETDCFCDPVRCGANTLPVCCQQPSLLL